MTSAASFVFLILVLSCVASFARNCTTSDWLAQYGECREGENQRDLLWYKDPKTGDCSGGVPQPPNKFNLPCDIACSGGSFLPLGETTCALCDAGKFSIGGGERVSVWSAFPRISNRLAFRTYAIATDTGAVLPAGAWASTDGGLSLRSGMINDSQASILELPIHCVSSSGAVSFTFTVDAEIGYDGLSFVVDGVQLMPLVSSVLEPMSFSANLSRGYHTLAWRYSKDISVSMGQDAAFIRSLEVRGIDWADSSCTSCPLGTANPFPSKSSCPPCPRNSISNTTGATSCIPCPSGTYSVEGSTVCLPRASCTDADSLWSFSACELRGGVPRRDKIYSWLPTTLCDFEHTSLPAAVVGIPCGLCNEGMIRASGTAACQWCPSSQASAAGSSTCVACGPGTSSGPGLYLTQFDDWSSMPGVTTGCTGSCGTLGWVPQGSFIHSGFGHGREVDSYIQVAFTLDRPSRASFTFTLTSTRWLESRLQIVDIGRSSLTLDYGSNLNASVDLDPGNHTLRFNLDKHNAGAVNNADYVVLSWLSIPGAVVAGASAGRTCSACPAGSASQGGTAYCSPCQAGWSSPAMASSCSVCQVDTFNPVAGGTCKACGHDVHAPAGSLDCPSNCTYSPDGGVTVFDVSSLRRDDMYGPVYDGTGFSYYVNLCTRQHSNITCVDAEGAAIDAYGCQVTSRCSGSICPGKNLGNIVGFYPLKATGTTGFVIAYTGGTTGCDGKERSMNVSFVCKPGAGVGTPAKPPGRLIEGPYCHYEIFWESSYGCPLCSSAHYSYFFGACENNRRVKTYYWLTNPKSCHDGVQLPEPETIFMNCTSTALCQPGSYAESVSKRCAPCSPGTYSVGSGISHPFFDEVPPSFTTECTGTPCAPFQALGKRLVSGYGASSVLSYAGQFVTSGSVSFTYMSVLPAGASFEFSVDKAAVFRTTSTSLDPKTFTAAVPVGGHILTWTFSGVTAPKSGSAGFGYVEIHSATFQGAQFAPFFCNSCWGGSAQPLPNSTTCAECPMNSVSPGAASCMPCSADQYSLDGVSCKPRPRCNESDWVETFTPCVDGSRLRVFLKLWPEVCIGGFQPVNSTTRIICADCQTGMFRANSSSTCVGCPAGTALIDGQCKGVPAGSIAMKWLSFFSDSPASDMREQGWPAGWSTRTVCSRGGTETTGWRNRGTFLDSGVFDASVSDTSILQFSPGLVTDGSISFEFSDPVGDLAVLLDGMPATLPEHGPDWQQVVLALPRSTGVVSFVVIQRAGALASPVKLRNVVVRGVADGSSEVLQCPPGRQANQLKTACTPCAAGTSNNATAGTCTPCPRGTFSADSGASTCTRCWAGTESELPIGSTRCTTGCVFTAGNTTSYNLTMLAGETIGPVPSPAGGSFFFSICKGEFAPGVCSAGNGTTHAHVCSSGVSFGSQLHFVPSTDKDTDFVLDFHGGSAAGCPAGTARETSIAFQCDMTAGAGHPQILASSSPCTVAAVWPSYAACHVCVREDYDEVGGSCSGGKRKIELVKRGNCNGPSHVVDRETKCSDIALPLGVIVGGVAAVAILVAIIAIIVWRHRRISVKYTKLLSEHPMELGEVDKPDS